jgi:hypothetical protein
VAVHFDGSGDEGVSEDIKCYATEDYAYEESEVHEVNFAEVPGLRILKFHSDSSRL